ncbi:MAG: hypothetical protein PHT30_04445 [Bacilli bacterium]|nr:hypothetical protein [Bacilli bacterium]
MKIYLVKSSEGSWDDYRERIEKAFFKKPDAKRFAINYNTQLRIDKKQDKKCEKCKWRKVRKVDFDKYSESLIPECFNNSGVDPLDPECENYYCLKPLDINFMWVSEKHPAEIEEIEVE